MSLQRSRLDIDEHQERPARRSSSTDPRTQDAARTGRGARQYTHRSTVTDPKGTGLAFSAMTATTGSCECTCFGFDTELQRHSYVVDVLNCTRRPDTVIDGRSARKWEVWVADEGVPVRYEYFAEPAASGPWPLRIITPAGTQDFDRFVNSTPDVAAFAPQGCCRGMPHTECARQADAGRPPLTAPPASALDASTATAVVRGRVGSIVVDDPWRGTTTDWTLPTGAGWAVARPVPDVPPGVISARQIERAKTNGRNTAGMAATAGVCQTRTPMLFWPAAPLLAFPGSAFGVVGGCCVLGEHSERGLHSSGHQWCPFPV